MSIFYWLFKGYFLLNPNGFGSTLCENYSIILFFIIFWRPISNLLADVSFFSLYSDFLDLVYFYKAKMYSPWLTFSNASFSSKLSMIFILLSNSAFLCFGSIGICGLWLTLSSCSSSFSELFSEIFSVSKISNLLRDGEDRRSEKL